MSTVNWTNNLGLHTNTYINYIDKLKKSTYYARNAAEYVPIAINIFYFEVKRFYNGLLLHSITYFLFNGNKNFSVVIEV